MAALPPPTREAVAVVLDVSLPPETFYLAKNVCSNLIQQKLIFAPRDEIGLVFAGGAATLNRLNTSAPNRFQNIAIARAIGPPTMDLYQHLDRCSSPVTADAAAGRTTTMDMLEALLVASDLIFEHTGERRYQRRVFLVSDVRHTVKRKEDLTHVITFMKQHGMHLVVIGVDFDEANAAGGQHDDWERLTTKQQNERVLQYLCGELGEGSMVVPVSDALDALSALRKRSIGQRAVARCVLAIGDVRIPVHIFTKTLLTKIPTLKKTAAKGLTTEKKYFSVANPEEEIDSASRVKAYRYGKSVIPFNEVDESQLKFESERSLMALGFIPISQVPFHLLLGGIRIIAPAPGDDHGAKALSAFVQGMDQLQRAMLVRFVRVTNADPLLGVCIPSAKVERDVLYFGVLPFAEDVRHYRFTTYSDVVVSSDEAAAVDAVVNAMTMDGDTLKPSTTFNPVLQYYYQCVRDRFLSAALKAKTTDDEESSSNNNTTCELPEPSTVLQKTCCQFGSRKSVLSSMIRSATGVLHTCGQKFPFVDPDDAADKKGGAAGKTFWFAKGGAVKVEPDLGGGGGAVSSISSSGAINASPRSQRTTTDGPTPMSQLQTAMQYHTDAAGAGAHGTTVVTTTDPVGTFRALLAASGADHVDRAIFEMTETIFRLIKSSIGSFAYSKCDECMDVLRAACVKEEEARSFNKFLINLMVALKGGDHDDFWTKHCVARGIRPITRTECEDSDVADAAAAEEFVRAERAAPLPVEGGDAEEDLFGQLE